MGDCCNCHTEVSRDGSGQLSRYLAALDPSYAPVDDRSIEDLLVFAKRYANQIRFYDIPGSMPGDEDKSKISWREFFRRDMAVIAASIALTDTAQIKKDYEELRAKIDEHPSYKIFDDLFDPILGMAVKIDGWYAIAIPENPLYADLKLAIDSNLKWQMQKIVAYEEGFKYVDSKHLLNLDYSSITNKDLWGLNDTINADITIYQGTDNEDKIRNAALYVDDIFNNFYGFIQQLIKNTEGYMQFALEQYPAHQPHAALFIAFLQLFRLAQDQVNGITQRMLDFYYSDVLHLAAKPSIPDKVHIVFELAKDVAEYDVAQGTQLKAPKDAVGKDQVYATENDLVVNQAKVKELKTIFIDKAIASASLADGTITNNEIIKNIYARPVANSKDGFGEKFTEPNSKWQTFGKGSAVAASNNLCDQVALLDEEERKDTAQVGFAIASPQLLMQGGNRLLQVKLNTNSQTFFQKAKAFETQNAAQSFFNIALTGEKDWIAVKEIMSQAEWDDLFITYTDASNNTVNSGVFNSNITRKEAAYFLDAANNTVAVFLPMSEKGVIGFDAKLHKGYDYKIALPVIKILLNGAAGLSEDDYKTISITSVQLNVKVGSINPSLSEEEAIRNSDKFNDIYNYHYDGLEKIILQNETGLVEAGKPFDPFTAYPAQGKSFYIGSEEVFNKPLGKLAVNIRKTQDSGFDASQFGSGEFNVSVLHEKFWDPLSNDVGSNFDQEHLTINILNHAEFPDFEGSPIITPVILPRTPIQYFNQWQLQSEKGFLQLAYAPQTTTDLQARQALAITLEIKEISISYESGLLNLDPEIEQFFHIYPFGVTEIYLQPVASFRQEIGGAILNTSTGITNFNELDSVKQGLLVNARNALFPQFDYLSPYAQYYINTNAFRLPQQNTILGNRTSALRLRSRSSTAAELIYNQRNTSLNSTNQYIGDTQQGMLFIGIEKLQTLQSISMLFQFAEGSAYNEDDDPPTINWAYLSYNEWKPLKAESIVFDGTYGFQTTGIIKMDIPADASSNNTIITEGLTWLCASVLENADRIPQLIDVVTQAAEAVFIDQDNDASHFDAALSAGSISKLAVNVAEISKVQQPFSSFDGKHAETGKEFYTRVSERLRHKARAITAWDYEHLVLDRFPSIYKVKCITHTDPNCLCTDKLVNTTTTVLPARITFNGDNATLTATANQICELLHSNPLVDITLVGYDFNGLNRVKEVYNILTGQSPIIIITRPVDPLRINYKIEHLLTAINTTLPEVLDVLQTEACCGPQVAPGHVLIIPVADLKNRNAANPLQPKTSRRTLLAIQNYLKTRTSPFVHVHAKNPVYEQIIVSFKVKFYSGIDKGFYIKKLNDEIVQFLTPWAFDETAEVKFNQKIYASSIINFIEERSYVDFITEFIMGVCCNDCCPQPAKIGNAAITGNVFDDENNPQPLAGVVMKIKELNKTVTTDSTGLYKIENLPAGNFTLVAYFSLFNVQKQSFTADKQGNITQNGNPIASINFYRGAGNRQDDVNEFFSTVCGCEGVEWLLKDDPNFEGDVTAKPCTSRSLLVSVPQHIIIPYEETPQPSPCEQRKNQAAFVVRTADANLSRDKIITKKTAADTPVKIEAKKSPEKIIATKKVESVTTKKAKASTPKTPKKKPQ